MTERGSGVDLALMLIPQLPPSPETFSVLLPPSELHQRALTCAAALQGERQVLVVPSTDLPLRRS